MKVLLQFDNDTFWQFDFFSMQNKLDCANIGHQMFNINIDLLLSIDYVQYRLSNLVDYFSKIIVSECCGGFMKLLDNEPGQNIGDSLRCYMRIIFQSAVLMLLYKFCQLCIDIGRHCLCIFDMLQARYNYYLMSIKILLSLAIVTLATLSLLYVQKDLETGNQNFEAFKQKFGKVYASEEGSFRKYIYLMNKAKIEEHNRRDDKTYKLEVNQFADLTLDQFKEMYLGLKVEKSTGIAPQIVEEKVEFQRDIDWRAEGKVTRVKDQKMCASCWAFCVVGAIESAYLIKGISQQFSQQQLVDCSNTYGNLGCRGGELEYTYHYIKDKGLNAESSYPYTGKDQNCKKTRGPFTMAGYSKAITCTGLYNALQKGPVSVAVDALFWAYYKEGIYDDCGNEVNHGVLVVGATSEYWLIKNSWGAQWGNNGYIKVKRGNTCSICEYPYFPQL